MKIKDRVRVKKHTTPCGHIDYVVEVYDEKEGWLMTEDCNPTEQAALESIKQNWS